MKKINIYYWICTGILIPALGIGSVYGIISHPASLAQFIKLGYPIYLAPFLGIARLLGLIAILTPKYSRIKEWAYAGLAFDVIGAIYSQLATGQPFVSMLFPLIDVLILFGSYCLYHKRLLHLKAAMPKV
ncbi:MAG: DoxX family protein [Chitinophagaceae bacterium]|nr:MAG: DoxX family protein [Chitinophagaceae bacterium]